MFSNNLKQVGGYSWGLWGGGEGGGEEAFQAEGTDRAQASGGSPHGEHEGSKQKPLLERPGGHCAVTVTQCSIRVPGTPSCRRQWESQQQLHSLGPDESVRTAA